MHDVPHIDRAGFVQALGAAVAAAARGTTHLGLMLIDIANLSRINRYHGYRTGDLVLATVHGQLLGISKLPDTVYRVGDHRFAFILPDLGNPAFIALAMNRVRRVLEQELCVGSQLVAPAITVGLAVNREGRRDAMTTLSRAESSLAAVKLGGTPGLDDLMGEEEPANTNFHLEQRFAEALQDNDFELYFQPKIDLGTGRVDGAEALLRWLPQDHAPVSPETVVELAEAAGRAYDLTKWVVHSALRQLRRWQSSLDITVAINIQAGLAGNQDLPSLLHDAMAIWGVEPARVTVEITESAIIEDKESGFDNLVKLRDQGINLAIDDFGTGYSSLSYFKQIPAAELKIDKSFVSSMTEDDQDLELVKIMITIAHRFGLRVVAEGVEDRASLDLLRELGCDCAQGYYFTPPLPRDEFEAWVRAWSGLPASD
ncbi:MAG: bifunctional diguanylate cyclase/phosphodiesterase [Halioglobus sp.]|nr:bifunctional diguanylate cyclase/phosphodiesterase [Halioglobus sp.]